MKTAGIRRWCLGFVVAAVILALATTALFVLFPRLSGGPVVSIIQPDTELVITSGQGLLVIAQAQGDLPIKRVDLHLDDEIALQRNVSQIEAREVTTSFPWFSSEPGRHTLSVIAYDSRNRPSDPAQVYVTVLRAGTLVDVLDDESSVSPDQSISDGQVAGEEGSSEDEWAGPIFDGGVGQPGGVIGGMPPILGDQPFGNVGFPDIPPPTISLGISKTLLGQQYEVYYAAQAAGNVALDRIELMRTRPDNGLSIPFIKDCDDNVICLHNDTFVVGITETWVITAQAFDTAGQASELVVELVQVSDDEGLGPAFIEGLFLEPRVNVVEMVVPPVNFHELVGIGTIISVHDILNILIEGGEESREEQDVSGDLSECLKLTVAPVGQGCSGDFCNVDVSVEVLCEATAPPGEDVLLFVKREYVPESGNPSFIDTSGWNQSGRSSVPSGSRFEIRDSQQCGADSIYSAILSYGNYPDSNLRTIDKAEVVHTLPPCSQDAINANIILTAESHPSGALVRYQFNPAGNWSTQLPAGQVDMKIFGHTSDYSENIGQREFSLEGSALPGSSDEFILPTARFCDRPTYYTFIGRHNSHEIFRVMTSLPVRPCPYELPVDIPIDLEFVERDLGAGNIYWYINYRYVLPPGVAWPEGDDVFVGLMHEGDTLPLELVGGVTITDEIRQRGYTVQDSDHGESRISCGMYEFRYYLIVVVDGYCRDLGPVFTITTSPCQ